MMPTKSDVPNGTKGRRGRPWRTCGCIPCHPLTLVCLLALFVIMYSMSREPGEYDNTPTGRVTPLPLHNGSGAEKPLLFTAADDEALASVLPRRGESPITHTQYLQCLADRLGVDVATRTQQPLDEETTVPLIVFPLMVDLADHRALMCSIGTSLRYVMFVDNGGTAQMGRLLADVEATVGWTGRVAVRRYPWNAGFSAAVNNAIDWALQLPQAEVPFIHVSNNDVRFAPGLLAQRVRDFRAATRHDAARIAELTAEVAAESESPEVLARYRSGRPLRGNWSVNASLVTSALLPDRIRYMPHVERKASFAGHFGTMFFTRRFDYSSFFISRLAALTAGYWDENFYPAYFEDMDFMWRHDMLGLRHLYLPSSTPATFTHFTNAVFKASDARRLLRRAQCHGTAGANSSSSPALLGATNTVEQVLSRFAVLRYGRQYHLTAQAKWGCPTSDGRRGVSSYGEPYMPSSRWGSVGILHWPSMLLDMLNGGSGAAKVHNNYEALPLDAWVRDTAYIVAIQRHMNQPLRLASNGKQTPPAPFTGHINVDLVKGYLS